MLDHAGKSNAQLRFMHGIPWPLKARRSRKSSPKGWRDPDGIGAPKMGSDSPVSVGKAPTSIGKKHRFFEITEGALKSCEVTPPFPLESQLGSISRKVLTSVSLL